MNLNVWTLRSSGMQHRVASEESINQTIQHNATWLQGS